MEILSVAKLVDDGQHNAFTDLYYWAGHFYLAYRTASGHLSGDGRIRIMRSADGFVWQQVAEVAAQGDCRDPKLLALGERLHLYTTVVPISQEKGRRAYVSVSEDGTTWPAPTPCGPEGMTFWRPRVHGKTCYVAAYEGDDGAPPDAWRSFLLESDDGLEWREVATIYHGAGASETELWIERDDRITALVRLDEEPRLAVVATSAPPYTSWKHRPTDRVLQAPMLRKVYRRYLVAGRTFDSEGRPQTALLWLQGNKLKLDAVLPSGGDTSYPGCCWLNEDELLLSYYSSHEYNTDPNVDAPAAIYLARLGFDF
jgi:hypothetical protein